MAEYHRVNAGEVRREFFPVVNQIEGHAAKGDGQVVGDGLCPVLVVVAPDDVEGGVLSQLVHKALFVDVPAVENGVGGFQLLRYLGPQQAVGVGEDGELHRTAPPSSVQPKSLW